MGLNRAKLEAQIKRLPSVLSRQGHAMVRMEDVLAVIRSPWVEDDRNAQGPVEWDWKVTVSEEGKDRLTSYCTGCGVMNGRHFTKFCPGCGRYVIKPKRMYHEAKEACGL